MHGDPPHAAPHHLLDDETVPADVDRLADPRHPPPGPAAGRSPPTSIDSPIRGTRPNSASTSPPTVLTSSRSKLWPKTPSSSERDAPPSTRNSSSPTTWIGATSSMSYSSWIS